VLPVKNRVRKEQFLVFIRHTRAIDEMSKVINDLEHQAALGKSVASFAHEVRNPINNMVVNLQAMKATGDLGADQQEAVDRMLNDCERLNHLMDSILSYAKPLEKKMKPLNLDLLIQMVLEKWEAKLNRYHIELVYQCEQNLPLISGDMRSLEQVFTNLVSNALEAMKPQNNGTLAIKIEKWEGNWIRINLSDTGPGIPEEIMKRLFSPFVSFSLQGTGLGLAITKEIISAHNGEISVESFPGGTVFHVLMPQVQGDSQ
jgi:signal transduction histidine kinase